MLENKRYFDTHCHLCGTYYQNDVDFDLKLAFHNGVKRVLVPGTNKDDSHEAIELAKKYPNHVYAAVGLHPSNAFHEIDADFLDKIDMTQVCAIGETGLDLYHKTNPPLTMQKKLFNKHIELALKHDKTLIIHAREAESEVYEMILPHAHKLRFIMHCFTGSSEWAQRFVAIGGYISLSGAITYQKTPTIKDVALNVPLERLICETDAPFLTPIPHRGKPNRLDYVRLVAKYIASIRPEDEKIILEALFENAHRALNLKN